MSEKVLYITMFKSFKIEFNGKTIGLENIKSEKVLKLLGYLMFFENRALPNSELIDLIWADEEIDNPINALKNLIYRLRTILRRELEIDDLILTGKNSYSINAEYTLDIDAQHFDMAYGVLQQQPENKEAYQELLTIYKGNFMNEIKEDHRSLSRGAYFHSRYVSSMIEYASLLEKEHHYEKMEEVARAAIVLDNLDEDLHETLIRSLYLQGFYQKAIETYRETTDYLYRTLGIEPSEEMKSLYEMMKKEVHVENLDIKDIQGELVKENQGAYLCEYGTFRDLYNMQSRMLKRLGVSAHLCLLTIHDTSRYEFDKEQNKKLVEKMMGKICTSLVSGLRVGDVVSRFSATQFVVLMSVCNYEDTNLAMNRVLKKINRSLNNKNIIIETTVQELITDVLEV